MDPKAEDLENVGSCKAEKKTRDAATDHVWRWSSAPSTPARAAGNRPALANDYRSDPEECQRKRRRRRRREIREAPRLEEAWEMRRSRVPAKECRVLVRSRRMTMDKEEVKACRELMLEIPASDLTVQVPAAFSDWKMVNSGDDPDDVKARLKIWAQAVALMSVLRLN
ncbi:hypothetical protein Cni_G18344 [Canna indica]|uniref:Uncharacterized protein n=1 Tax=Canna indica TaxID=4628 RepID=A0AAQ3QE98_9LILI|nr:hypothetical protein Cni_G18344 [Canna indica]